MADGNGPRYKAPAVIKGVDPEASRALVATLRELEAVLARDNTDVVDRRQKTSVRAQPNQILRASNGSAVLPHPAPARAQRCMVIVEQAPVRLSVENKGRINGEFELVVNSVGALEAVSTGEAWWIVGNGVLLTAQASDLPAGATGARGLSGTDGATGAAGIPGLFGLEGLPGVPGQPGSSGAPGLAGVPGGWGAEGLPGVPGVRGERGFEGPPGVPGLMGFDGLSGPPGAAGAQGPQGIQGDTGPAGSGGGSVGAPGDMGPEGIPGVPGGIGPAGVKGDAGEPGFGLEGLPGVPGLQGALGPQGFPGIPGLMGDMGLPGVPGAPGVAGPTGATGATGAAGSAGAGLLATATLALGNAPRSSGYTDLTGLSGLTTNDRVGAARDPSTTSQDECEDQVAISGIVTSATTIRFFWEVVGGGPVSGNLPIMYWLLTGITGDDFTSVQRADADADNTSAVLTALPTFNISRHRVADAHEFLGSTARGIMGSMRPWGSAKIYKLTSEANHPGALRIVIPLGTSGGLCMGDLPNEQLWDPSTLLGFRAILNLRTANPVSDYDVMVGFADDFTLAQNATVSAIGYASANSGGDKFMGITRATSTQTTVVPGTPTITVGNWFLLEAYLTGGVWEFFINGATKGTSSTNIPTPLMNFGLRIADDGGGTVDFVVDVDTLLPLTGTLGQRWT